LSEIERNAVFSVNFRILHDGKYLYVQLRAAMVEEPEGMRLIVGINDIDSRVRHEADFAKRLEQAQSKANLDALTGVKNRNAYLGAEERLDSLIAKHHAPNFAIVILDVNNLKKVNDEEGHQAGDQYLRDACKIICDIFKRSPVFRVGGDEFAVIAQGNDYASIEELLGRMDDHNTEALHSGGIVIAQGMARYRRDANVAAVFERADQNMYQNKLSLKSGKHS